MKSFTIRSTVFFIVLISVQTTSSAETSANVSTTPHLILALDVKALARHINNTATYTNLYHNPSDEATPLLEAKLDTVSKKLKDASKVFKRFTSIRYRKGQKIRAKIGKSSLTLKYTHAL